MLPEALQRPLRQSADALVARADRLHRACQYAGCLAITERVLARDAMHPRALLVHLACLVELARVGDLFLLAHRLIDACPLKALAYYAVGCYYTAINKPEKARAYFRRATAVDRGCGPAWLGYGHTFADTGADQQALAAYNTAANIMEGHHGPLLCTGVIYARLKSIELAGKFIGRAIALSPDDPAVWHEMGALLYAQDRVAEAQEHFARAADLMCAGGGTLSAKCEPTLVNLGHCLLRLGRYEAAIERYSAALALRSDLASTYAAIGFAMQLRGDAFGAIDYYHKVRCGCVAPRGAGRRGRAGAVR